MNQNAESLYACGFSAFVISMHKEREEGISYAANKKRSDGVDSGWSIK